MDLKDLILLADVNEEFVDTLTESLMKPMLMKEVMRRKRVMKQWAQGFAANLATSGYRHWALRRESTYQT
jgi:hypothetical protein